MSKTPTRPPWWIAWNDYLHGGWSERQARDMNRYCVQLEEMLMAAQDALGDAGWSDEARTRQWRKALRRAND